MTVDLPTPPLPDDTSSGRVFEPAWANGTVAPFGVSVRLSLTRRRAGIAVQPLAQLFAVGVGHHRELEFDAGHAVERCDGVGDATLDLVAQRASGHREGDEDPDAAVVAHVDVAQHPEVDDRSVQLRVLDGTESARRPARA